MDYSLDELNDIKMQTLVNTMDAETETEAQGMQKASPKDAGVFFKR